MFSAEILIGRSIQILGMLGIFTLFSGCGFQLRGQVSGDSIFNDTTIAIVSAEVGSELSAMVKSELILRGASFTTLKKADLVVQLGKEKFIERNLSLSARARAAEFEVEVNVPLSVQKHGQHLIDQEIISMSTQMINDPLNPVGKTEELRLLRGEIQRELALKIARRVIYRLRI